LENQALEHIRKLLKDNTIPALEGDLADIPVLQELHHDLKGIREILYAFSRGDLSPVITIRGIIPGCLKALQAHLRHMIWQVQMVEQGDFTQRVQFLGEFSTAFNSMVHKLDYTLTMLKKKEETLTAITNNLRNEVNMRNSAVEALQESESRFKFLAEHDPLTGALNRRSFIDRAVAELKIAAERAIPCCMVIMDIDFFKQFNDTHGHLAGDEALRHSVNVISATLRKNDFMGRYGGEEFVFMFFNADRETGIAISERLREVLIANPVKLETGTFPLTASFGVAPAVDGDPEEESYIQTLINSADIALYRAKQTGRNQVVCFEPKMASGYSDTSSAVSCGGVS
ncbi:MAG: GGDEF domain-containing protein, partial [Treponema sp.]|nr:GGDEF domain-containing protein [Treponema sp.]